MESLVGTTWLDPLQMAARMSAVALHVPRRARTRQPLKSLRMPGHVWTWVGNVRDLEAVFAADLSGLQHIGAHLENDRHRNGWNVSEEFGQPIPEPSAALVFGVGIAFVGTRLRRTTRLS